MNSKLFSLLLCLMIIFSAVYLQAFTDITAVDDQISGELIVNYDKNVKLVNGRIWILYYDADPYPLTTELRMARQQDDGSFAITVLQQFAIDQSIIPDLDCTFCVNDNHVTVFFMKPFPNITDIRVWKLLSDDLLDSFYVNDFTSQFADINDMELLQIDDKQQLVLLRGNRFDDIWQRSVFYEYSAQRAFNASDYTSGDVFSAEDIYISASDGDYPLFTGHVACTGRIIDSATGAPAQNSINMDTVFLGGYAEQAACDVSLSSSVAENMDGYHFYSSLDRGVIYIRIDGNTALCRFGDYVTVYDTLTVYDHFPDPLHPEIAIGDSIWTNVVEKRVIDWDESTFSLFISNASSLITYCETWIEGTLSGVTTFACTENIYITNDLLYDDIEPGDSPLGSSNYLGLFSDKNIKIRYKHYDPWEDAYVEHNCDGVYIYGLLAALGEVEFIGEEWKAGSLKAEYLHPHGSTPAMDIVLPGGSSHSFSYPDLNKFVYSNSSAFPGDEGYIMHSAAKPDTFPACGFPYEDPEYLSGDAAPYGTDFPFYNPVYPESSDDIVFSRGTVNIYGALYERTMHQLFCDGEEGSSQHQNNAWAPEDDLWGGAHDPCGYNVQINYDTRFLYDIEMIPGYDLLLQQNGYYLTILESNNNGQNYNTQYNQLDTSHLISNSMRMATDTNGQQLAVCYKTHACYKVFTYDTQSHIYQEFELDLTQYDDVIKNFTYNDEGIYFAGSQQVFRWQLNNLMPCADLITADTYGFNYLLENPLLWNGSLAGESMLFSFWSGDSNWQFTPLGESMLSFGNTFPAMEVPQIQLIICEDEQAHAFAYGSLANNEQAMYYSSAELSELTGLSAEDIPVSSSLKLHPNPFNPELTISFSFAEDAESTQIMIYNVKGQVVRSYNVKNSHHNDNQVVWDGKDEKGIRCASGVYLIKLSTGKSILAQKAVMIK